MGASREAATLEPSSFPEIWLRMGAMKWGLVGELSQWIFLPFCLFNEIQYMGDLCN